MKIKRFKYVVQVLFFKTNYPDKNFRCVAVRFNLRVKKWSVYYSRSSDRTNMLVPARSDRFGHFLAASYELPRAPVARESYRKHYNLGLT